MKLIHEIVHVDQVGRYGGEAGFACAYGRGYLEGGGQLPAYIDQPTLYHRNPLEAEAYRFDARFSDASGQANASLIPGGEQVVETLRPDFVVGLGRDA